MTASAVAATGRAALTVGVKIGRLPLSIRTTDASYAAALEQRFANFRCVPGESCGVLDVTLTPLRKPEGDMNLEVLRRDGQWWVRRSDFTANWDPARRRGAITQAANPHLTDSIIRVLHSLELAANDGFLLHAASAIRGGRAFLLAGVSGAGKTTLSRLAPADAIYLTDEISYVQGAAGQYSAFGTPFTGELNLAGVNTAGPVAGIYFLMQGTTNRLNPLAPKVAIGKLMRNILFFARDPDLTASVFRVACDFLAATPAWELVFKPEPSAWELLA